MSEQRAAVASVSAEGARSPARPALMDVSHLNTERHLERNLALAKPEDTARGMFFNGVLDAVRTLANEEVALRCRAATGERKHIDFFSYPVSSFLKMCLEANQQVGARLGGCEKVLRRIGEQSTHDFLSSMAGKTAILLAGGSVKRLLGQLPSSYRAAVSYGDRVLTWTGERSGRFIIQQDFMPPAYHEGVLLGVMEAAGVRPVLARGRMTGPLDSEYELSWE